VNFIKCVEIFVSHKKSHRARHSLREIYLNANKILCIVEDNNMKDLLNEGMINDLSKDHEFTRIMLDNGTTVSIVGGVEQTLEKVT